MLAHALTIVVNELKRHFTTAYGVEESQGNVALANIAAGVTQSGGADGAPRNTLVISVVNIREEKTLKNLSNYVRDEVTLKASYENPPIYLNFSILLTATHADYSSALVVLSRALRFFQSRHIFTQENVSPNSITTPARNPLDQLSTFKLILDLYSPTLEEVNHMWGTLGGKQFPFALYNMRMLDLKYSQVESESGLITEVVSDFHHKNGDPH